MGLDMYLAARKTVYKALGEEPTEERQVAMALTDTLDFHHRTSW